MHSLLLLAALLLSSGHPPSSPQIDLLPPPTRGFPAPTPPGWPDPLPVAVPLQVLLQPDWSDYHVYPRLARRHDHEGSVVAETIIGQDGVPRLCHIASSSGYADLDEGTCQLLMQMRFSPPRERGLPIETFFRRRFHWLLTDPISLAPGRMTARITLWHGTTTGCGLDQDGVLPGTWMRIACGIFRRDIAYYVRDRDTRSALATIVVDLRPEDAPPVEPLALSGRLVATKQTAFEVDTQGDPVNCRLERDEGFGAEPPTEERVPCGFFLTGAWFHAKGGSPKRGIFEMRVYVQDGKGAE